ncbi:MAG: DUF1929 domain-containing protein [Trueperaceae bacterium]|nr:DUF1929 domain-containing protein [Trueperaceae bacterium]
MLRHAVCLGFAFCFILFISSCNQLDEQQTTERVVPGLEAEYFGQADFTGPVVQQIDSFIYFDWDRIAANRNLLPEQFSIRWQADLKPTLSQRYQFFLSAEGEAKLYIDSREIKSGTELKLFADKTYAFKLEFRKTQAEASVKLEWQKEDGSRELIPQSVFWAKAMRHSATLETATATPNNLLLNGDFEGGRGAWIAYGGSFEALGLGNNGSAYAAEAKGWAWVQQNIPVTSILPGEIYSLKASARALNGATCTVGVAGGSSSQTLFDKKLSFTANSWTMQGLSFTVPDSTVWAAVYFSSSNEACQVDDIALLLGEVSNPPAPAQAPLRNGSFEEGLTIWGQYGGNAELTGEAPSGTKALSLSQFAWVQQDIAASLLVPGQTYVLSAYARAAQTSSCNLGFVGASPTATLFHEKLIFNSQNYHLQFLKKTIPDTLSWAAVYLSSGSTSCDFDAIRLEESEGTPGHFGPVINWPIIPIHAVLSPEGELLTYGTDKNGRQTGQFFYDVWNPQDPLLHNTLANTTETDIFCSAQLIIPASGDILITGGDARPSGRVNKGVNDVTVFDSSNRALSKSPLTLLKARWYPTATTLPDGKILLQGGIDFDGNTVTVPELFTPGQGWTLVTGAAHATAYGLYPRAFVIPSGKVLMFMGRSLRQIDVSGAGSIETVGQLLFAPRDYLPAVMYRPGQILSLGVDGTASTVDARTAQLSYAFSQSPSQIRAWSNLTLLADGDVFLSGGSLDPNTLNGVAYHTEIWQPETSTWTQDASAKLARLYHSTAILLPDATVLTAGGGAPGPLTNLNAEIFYPGYLFKQDGSGMLAERPEIRSVEPLSYAQSFKLSLVGSPTISKVSLIKTGSVTHSFNMEQRFIELAFSQTGNELNIVAPENSNVATPGFYMLFVFDQQGVPSKAKIVALN